MNTVILKNHKFIVFSVDHYNPLGVIRSLGEEGIKPFAIVVSDHTPSMIPNSKYLGGVKVVSTIEAGYRFLIDTFSQENNKSFL